MGGDTEGDAEAREHGRPRSRARHQRLLTVTTSAFFGHYARMLGKPSIPVAPTTVVVALAATIGRLLGDGDVSPDAVCYIARHGGNSIEKARTVLGYRPAVDLVEGMRRTDAWLRETGGSRGKAEKAPTLLLA